jgi:DNA-directed RNA polymerase specialized sigma24 family protein
MSWFHASTAGVDARNYASPAEIVACFQDRRNVLVRLGFLITGDQVTAEQAVVQACEMTLQGNSPFRDWLFEWAKAATIATAISDRTEAIRICEAAYKDRRCPHVEHLSQGDADERASGLDLILGADAQTRIAELDPLCRAVLVLRVAIRSSIQDCALRLNVSRAAVVGANCHALTWLHERHVKPVEENHGAFHEAEQKVIIEALKAASGRISGHGGAAERLGLKRTTLQNKMRRLGISKGTISRTVETNCSNSR